MTQRLISRLLWIVSYANEHNVKIGAMCAGPLKILHIVNATVTPFVFLHSAWRTRADELSDSLKNTMLLGHYMVTRYRGHYYAKAQNLVRRLRRAYDEALARYDLLLMPTLPMVATPLPEANARVAALRSGQVDWIEAPAPDAVASLKQAGFKIITNAYPHNWTWHLSRAEGSPWNDIRVRKAANLAIDRDAIVKLLGGLVTPAYGEVDRSSAWFGKPTFEIKYAPDEARKLMTEAGYSKTKPLQARISIQASGTNQTVNEAIQEMLKEAFFNIEFKAVELETLMTGWRGGAKADMNKDVSATNVTHVTSDPFYAVNRFFASDQTSPTGVNWSFYKNPEVDQLVVELKNSFDPAKQDEIAAKIHAKAVDDAVMIWVYHDTTPRALSAKIKKYVQAQSWFQDLALVEI